MMILIVSAVAAYSVGTLLQGVSITRPFSHDKFLVLLFGFLAIVLHGALLHRFIDGVAGQNLNVLNMFSLSAWLISILLIVVASLKRVEMLSLVIYPIAALSIVLILLFPRFYIVNTATQPIMIFHIFISVLALGVFCLAGLMAVMIFIEDYLLRAKQGVLMQKFPPLLTSEKLMFQLITIGFILLSLVLCTSFYFYYGLVLSHFVLLQKTILASLAWLVFAVLLLGRYYWGWRGRRAVYGTIFGVLLLVAAYFVSKLVLEALN